MMSQGRYSRSKRFGDMNRRGTRGAAAPHVLMIGSEGLPFSKTGGLADVLGSLPPAIARRGWDVTVVLPRYRGVDVANLVGQLERFFADLAAQPPGTPPPPPRVPWPHAKCE